MIQQTTFTLRPRTRGFHLVTDEVLSHLPALPKTGLLNLFIQHTSAGLSINENCDPDVRSDMEKFSITWCVNGNPGTTIRWKAGTTCPPMPNRPWWEPACLSR